MDPVVDNYKHIKRDHFCSSLTVTKIVDLILDLVLGIDLTNCVFSIGSRARD